MLTFLVLFSLILHLLSFIVIRFLFQKIQNQTDAAPQTTESAKQTEELLSAYLHEFREENNRLINEILQEKNPASPEQTNNNQPALTEKNNNGRLNKAYGNPPAQPEAETPYMPPLSDEQEDIVEESAAAKVYSLYDRGYSIEEIAKKLNLGKTEVELMVKFHRKN
ncbi:DUF6115 domain-containing protein [Sediminibacillus albus]|uniref:Uncharacterized protein n=1 Tax=Sediminibacillus albus TaxID=407036 RepID=A0A1G8W361_9BACI|nr:hypothetical protein [Sediminibacillus albus]SDJ71900.1 hypothetical protein SAMN05216243_0488 [Sediminibacillus albus]